jgi:3-phenylpropionate/trans-cinnamate dioxygenase ferredoxin subunit
MTLVRACALADLAEAAPFRVELEPVDVALVRIGDEIFAIEDRCSHAEIELSVGDVDASQCTIECALHGSQFDLRNGNPTGPPATSPVPVYPVVVNGDDVYLELENA